MVSGIGSRQPAFCTAVGLDDALATMKITGFTCLLLLDPAHQRDATSSAQDDIVAEVHTDEGITGIGETELNAWIERACIESPGPTRWIAGSARC